MPRRNEYQNSVQFTGVVVNARFVRDTKGSGKRALAYMVNPVQGTTHQETCVEVVGYGRIAETLVRCDDKLIQVDAKIASLKNTRTHQLEARLLIREIYCLDEEE